MNNLIEVNNLSFSYDNEKTLENIDLNIKESKIIAIVGKNGGGKSTLVKIILNYGKKFKYSGNIKYNISKEEITYLPQIAEFQKNFPITVFEVVISGLTNKKNIFRKFNFEEKKKTIEILKEFNIYDKKDEQISNISGGQLQRTLLARAFIGNKKLIFLDEPETYLDYNFFKNLVENFDKKDKTLVIITHELGNIRKYIDEVYIVEKYIKKENVENFHSCGCEYYE